MTHEETMTALNLQMDVRDLRALVAHLKDELIRAGFITEGDQ